LLRELKEIEKIIGFLNNFEDNDEIELAYIYKEGSADRDNVADI
jgi:hypothetical protein